MKKNIKILISSIVVFICLAGVSYYKYKTMIKYPDSQSKILINNIVDMCGDDNTTYITNNFNYSIYAFRGLSRINLDTETKNISITLNESQAELFVIEDKIENNEEIIHGYKADALEIQNACDEYKYYNENELNLYLDMYNYFNNNNLSVEDIKSFIDNEELEKKDSIKKYVDWFYELGENYLICYGDRFDRINEQDELYKKDSLLNGTKKFSELNFTEKKEIIDNFNNLGIINEYLDRELEIIKNN